VKEKVKGEESEVFLRSGKEEEEGNRASERILGTKEEAPAAFIDLILYTPRETTTWAKRGPGRRREARKAMGRTVRSISKQGLSRNCERHRTRGMRQLEVV
jgi:hypothetical protein